MEDGDEYQHDPSSLILPTSAAKRVVNGNAYWFDPRDYNEDIIVQLSITGPITKHDQYCGPEGITRQSNRLRMCYNARNVQGILLKIDSGGGEGNAGNLMADTVKLRNKPVVAFCDDFTCSAAYGLASAADIVVANNETTRIGSIGTYLTIADFTQQLEMSGIKLTEIYATASKDKNQDYYQAIAGNTKPLQAVVDRYNDDFLARIRTNRPDAASHEKEWNSGKVFFADEALSIGLIDAIDSIDNAFNYFS